ncbi:aspartate aminotransferase family protein [Elusimicrobiota bacterium]
MCANEFNENLNVDLDSVLQLDAKAIYELHQNYLNPMLSKFFKFLGLNIRVSKAKGIYITDPEGVKYMDFLSGYCVLNLGHEPDAVIDALRKVENYPNILLVPNPFAGKLAEILAKVTPGSLSHTFFCNSGSEAVEAAIKIARASTGREILLYTQNSFHGKTCGSLSVTGKEKYQEPFKPLLPGTKCIPYNDIGSLETALKEKNVAAFILEPIQGEAGVIIPDNGYLKECERLCKKNKVLFIVDEIQTGLGRTGKLFCSNYEDLEPDVMCLSKSLGGGVMPIGAMITTEKIWKKAYGSLDTCGLHTSTFNNNTRACACGIAAMNEIIKSDYIENARVQGEYLLAKLKLLEQKYSIIHDVRGKGLMIGVTFPAFKGNTSVSDGGIASMVVRHLLSKHKILVTFTINNLNVVRISPPLFVSRDQIDIFLEALEDSIKKTLVFSKIGLTKKQEKA